RWWDSNERQHTRSTKLGFKDKKAAQKLADQWEAASRSDAVAKQQHKVVSDLLSAKGLLTPTGQFVETWFKGKVHHWSVSTANFNRKVANKLVAWLGPERICLPMSQISKSDLVALRASFMEGKKGVSAGSAEHDFSVIRAIWRAAYREEVIDKNLTQLIA